MTASQALELSSTGSQGAHPHDAENPCGTLTAEPNYDHQHDFMVFILHTS